MRALASSSSYEDYRKYDIECDNNEEIEHRQRSPKEPHPVLSIRPNPSLGNIDVLVEEPDRARQLLITDLSGSIHYTTDKVYATQNININDPGVYILHIKYNDKTSAYEKFVILE